jgi:hypothetical protein
MQRNSIFNGKFIGLLLVMFVTMLSVQSAFPQCDKTYFKTGYHKIISTTQGDYPDYMDWNNDGKVDFWRFLRNQTDQTLKIAVYLNNGSGDWNWSNPIIGETTIPQLSGVQQDYTILDYDGDGDKDIFYVQSNSQFTLLKNNGSYTFVAGTTQSFQDVSSMGGIGFLDVNGDNRLDWLILASQPNIGQSIGYRLANADGTYGDFIPILTGGTAQNSSNFKLIDFDGDGKTDIVYSKGLQYYFLKNNGGASFTPGTGGTLDRAVSFMQVKDFNNDGKADILGYEAGNHSGTPSAERRIDILYGQGNGTFNKVEVPTYLSTTSDNSNVVIGEFNGDNFPDLIELDSLNQSFYSIYINNGAGGFTRTDYLKKIVNAYNYRLADFNGDGKTDILVLGEFTHPLANMFGEQLINIQYSQCQSYGAVKTPNFDGNELPDIAMWNPGIGKWRSLNATWFYTQNDTVKENIWGAGSFGDVPAPGDFDADGKTDYSVYRDSTGTWYIYLSGTSAWYVYKFGVPGDIAVPNDYDGGGKTDIAVFRPSEGNWYILSSETGQYSVTHFGASGDKPVPADYDGDDKTDVAIFRPSEGNWYYLKSSDQSFAVFHWGISTDKPIPADYDGDGKADLTVFRDGDWYIQRSSNNSFNYIHWGTTGDVPYPSYDNGASAAPVVYRAGTSAWLNYAKQSGGAVLGGTGYVPIYFGLPNN